MDCERDGIDGDRQTVPHRHLPEEYTPEEVGTFTNTTVQAGAKVTSPVTGTIVCWRITDATGGPFRLRVLTPDGGNTYTGVRTSAPQTPTGIATQSFATNLSIRAGQAIGLDDSIAGDQFGYRLTRAHT